MKGLLLASIVCLAAQDGKVYEHTQTNLKFTIAGQSRLAKKRGDWTITFPCAPGKSEASLQIFAVSFMADPEVWEGAQKYFVEQQRMTMLDQGREEILGVPLLLSRMQETATPDRKITLSGLIYAASEFKMSFRLTAKEADFAEAEGKWRQALQTLATIDGRLPEPERPGRTAEAPATKNKPITAPEVSRTTIGNSDGKPELAIGEVRFATEAAGKKIALCVPKGWELRAGEGGAIRAVHAAAGLEGDFSVASTLDSPVLARALGNRVREALSLFTLVRIRQETLPKMNLAGAKMTRIYREGENAGAPVQLLQAGAEKGDFYWLFEMRPAAKPTNSQWEAIESLLHGASIEPLP